MNKVSKVCVRIPYSSFPERRRGHAHDKVICYTTFSKKNEVCIINGALVYIYMLIFVCMYICICYVSSDISHRYIMLSFSAIGNSKQTYLSYLSQTNEPRHEISNNMVCATSKASDQPAHTRSLIRAFTCRSNIIWLLSF